MLYDKCRQCGDEITCTPSYELSEMLCHTNIEKRKTISFCSKECLREYMWEEIKEDLMELGLSQMRQD